MNIRHDIGKMNYYQRIHPPTTIGKDGLIGMITSAEKEKPFIQTIPKLGPRHDSFA
ncbi:hypothetical protein APX70_00094 [Pseudomonas syringae pv. maculicola]|uniref:Uncharacterized protein n=1 Tax=Pseudomonas syringae pv. maculicola TaxID=59511 RepID=A0A3M2ZX77_PSEYM|nr:hypothetical protein APX70_00094 [Pseudomonas syringae pv. maculicola]